MQRILFLFSLGGSGQHAIMRWLCKQTEPALYYNNCNIRNYEVHARNSIAEFVDGEAFNKRYDKFRPHIDMNDYNLAIYNFINKFPEDWWSIAKPFSGKCFFSVVVRDHYNFIASRFSKGLKRRLKEIIEIWKRHISLCLNKPDNFVDINYNEWNSNIDYRMQLCNRIEIPFTDDGINDTPFIGATKFDNKDYNNRWKKYKDNKNYLSYAENKELIELTKAYFGIGNVLDDN